MFQDQVPVSNVSNLPYPAFHVYSQTFFSTVFRPSNIAAWIFAVTFNEMHIYSVSSLTKELKSLVENKYRFIQVQGEISNLKVPFSGHHYFTLKDDGAQLRSVLFKGQTRYLEKPLQDGQQIVCHGRISIYEPRGDYQIIIDTVDFHGSGLLQAQFEKLKKKLHAEGLFAKEQKKALPLYPKTVVLITSATGAAIHDFLTIWRKRAYPADIKVYPVRVQGDGAAEEIAAAVNRVNKKLPECDIIVLCRGGGSLEDLFAFNEEVLARAIAGSSIPIVSGVGHEVDFSISDFCADVRAATPTAAAERIFPDFFVLQQQLIAAKEKMTDAVVEQLEDYQQRINQNRRLLGDMNLLFTNVSLRLDHAAESLIGTMHKNLSHKEQIVNQLSVNVQNLSPGNRLKLQEQRLTFAKEKLSYLFRQKLEEKSSSLARQSALLDAVSPLATLARGYAIAEKLPTDPKKTNLIHDASQINKGEEIRVHLHRGKLTCKVLSSS